MLLGVPVNPDGPACPRFIAREPTLFRSQQESLTISAKSEVNFAKLKRRLDMAEVELRRIKAMLNRLK